MAAPLPLNQEKEKVTDKRRWKNKKGVFRDPDKAFYEKLDGPSFGGHQNQRSIPLFNTLSEVASCYWFKFSKISL